jgi:hypothetical protein
VVGVAGDCHELGEAWPTQEGMVDAGEVDHPKGDTELDAPEGHYFLLWDNPIE